MSSIRSPNNNITMNFNATSEMCGRLFGNEPISEYEERLLAAALARPLTQAETKIKPGGGQYVYIESHELVNLANATFGFDGWSSRVKNLSVLKCDRNGTHWEVSCSAIVRIELKNGTFREDVGVGTSKFPSRGDAIEKAKKEAVTDGRKRALRQFGSVLGNCLYDKTFLKVMPVGERKVHASVSSTTTATTMQTSIPTLTTTTSTATIATSSAALPAKRKLDDTNSQTSQSTTTTMSNSQTTTLQLAPHTSSSSSTNSSATQLQQQPYRSTLTTHTPARPVAAQAFDRAATSTHLATTLNGAQSTTTTILSTSTSTSATTPAMNSSESAERNARLKVAQQMKAGFLQARANFLQTRTSNATNTITTATTTTMSSSTHSNNSFQTTLQPQQQQQPPPTLANFDDMFNDDDLAALDAIEAQRKATKQ